MKIQMNYIYGKPKYSQRMRYIRLFFIKYLQVKGLV